MEVSKGKYSVIRKESEGVELEAEWPNPRKGLPAPIPHGLLMSP